MLQNKDAPPSQVAVSLSISRQFTNCILFLPPRPPPPNHLSSEEKAALFLFVKLTVLKQTFICTYKHVCTPGLLAHATSAPRAQSHSHVHGLTPAMPVWFMYSPSNADNSQASHVWRTSQIGRAWPEATWKEAGAPGTLRRRWLWHSAQGAPASFSVGEWILQAPVSSDQHISNCCSEGETRLG